MDLANLIFDEELQDDDDAEGERPDAEPLDLSDYAEPANAPHES